MGQKDSKDGRKNQIVIGIDFGSCGITFAYGYLDGPKNEINLGRFEEQGINNKVSTQIILDDDLKTVLAFGNECSSFLSSSQTIKYHHFKNIKMNLYKRLYKIKANNSGKDVDIEYIITIILKEVKKRALAQIKEKRLNLDEKNVHWVITVPAIWEMKSKQIMINASQNAGLIRDDDDPSNFFALEPEAASIYYHYSREGKDNSNIDRGKPFILCDLGSGTVDIVTQKLKNEDKISFEEIYPPIGGEFGCNIINENFIEKVIKPLFGEECFNKTKKNICREKYSDWNDFEENIELFKKRFIKESQIDQNYKIDCDIFKKEVGNEEQLIKLIDNFNSKNPHWKLNFESNWKILFPFRIINDLMSELINIIKNKYIKQILESIEVKTLIFTGGASSNPILYKMMKENNSINLLALNYVTSPNPEVAIAYGSVLYSNDHFIISPRKAKFTFGIKCTKDLIEKYKKGGKIFYNKRKNKYQCSNCFSKFITIKENLRPDKEISQIYEMEGSKATIQLYKTIKEDATFIDETDKDGELIIFKFGQFIIDVGDKFDNLNREVEVKMKLGGTFISAFAIYKKTNQISKITCLYE